MAEREGRSATHKYLFNSNIIIKMSFCQVILSKLKNVRGHKRASTNSQTSGLVLTRAKHKTCYAETIQWKTI